jgi:hypothetical protein
MLIWIAVTALSYLAASVRFAVLAKREHISREVDRENFIILQNHKALERKDCLSRTYRAARVLTRFSQMRERCNNVRFQLVFVAITLISLRGSVETADWRRRADCRRLRPINITLVSGNTVGRKAIRFHLLVSARKVRRKLQRAR